MNKLSRIITATAQTITVALFAGLPLFFLPVTQDMFDTNKWILLAGAALLILLLTAITAGLGGTITVSLSPLTLGFGALTIASVISLIFSSSNRWEAMLLPIGVGTFVALTLIAKLTHPILTQSVRRIMRHLLVASATVTSVIAIGQFFGLWTQLMPGVAFLADPLWSPVGSAVGLLVFMALILPLVVGDLLAAVKKQSLPSILASGIPAALLISGLLVTFVRMIPLYPKAMLPLASGWAIVLEVLKHPRQAAVGVGLENFIGAFTTARPVGLNNTDLWTLRFAINSSFLFHIIATLGFIGLAATVVLFLSLLPKVKRVSISAVSMWVALAALLLLPPNLTVLVTITAVWLLTHPSEPRFERTIKLPKGVVSLLVLVVFVVLSSVGLYFAGRAYAAELVFAQSLASASQNKGTDTYNRQIAAIRLNPYVSRFHLTYSRTNLALASAIAQKQENGQPATLTDTDRATVTQLIQQAIREAKTSVNLAPNNVFMLENLAGVYRALIGIAQGADTWTIASLQGAIQLDPTNPVLRLDLGGVYFAQQNLDAATQQFLIAANLKPDWANAYYNLSYSYRFGQKTDLAIAAMEKTLSLVAPDSADYTKAQNELNELKRSRQPKEEETPAASLTQPPSGEPIIVPPLTLPESEGPGQLPTPETPAPTGETPAPNL